MKCNRCGFKTSFWFGTLFGKSCKGCLEKTKREIEKFEDGK